MMYFEIDDFNALREALHRFEDLLAKEQISEDVIFTGKLVADELLSNVLQHGGGKAFFSVFLHETEIQLSVRGSNDFCPPETSSLAEPFAESGRGLFLVDSLCSRREYSKEEGVTVYLRIMKKTV